MKFNSIIIRAIINSFSVSETELQEYFKDNIAGYQSCLEINHEYMMDASILFNLLEKLRKKHSNTDEYYSYLYKFNVLHLGLLGNFLLTCKNMYVVHEKLEKYEMLISDFVELRYRCVNNEIYCGAQIPYSLVKAEYNLTDIFSIVDFELIFRHRVLESIVRGKIKPVKVMIHEKFYSQERLTKLKKLFNCEIYPHNNYNEIVYSLEKYTRNIEYSNYTSYHLLEPHIDNHLAKLYNSDNYSRIIKRILMNNLHAFPLSIEEVAHRLLMSVRNLQKHLQKENMTYQHVCNDMKKEVAVLYLSKGYKLKEIAGKLGYKEYNSFTRSFKKWYGMTPEEYKQKNGFL